MLVSIKDLRSMRKLGNESVLQVAKLNRQGNYEPNELTLQGMLAVSRVVCETGNTEAYWMLHHHSHMVTAIASASAGVTPATREHLFLIGVSTNDREMLEAAADQGVAAALEELGQLEETRARYAEAYRYYTRAAHAGLPASLFKLAEAYELGEEEAGLPVDPPQAAYYYYCALVAGVDCGAALLRVVREHPHHVRLGSFALRGPELLLRVLGKQREQMVVCWMICAKRLSIPTYPALVIGGLVGCARF